MTRGWLATALLLLAVPAWGGARPPSDVALDGARKPAEMLALLQVAPGQRVLDVVAGGGYYTRLLADAVGPGGEVVAHSTEGLFAAPGMAARWSGLKRSHPNVRLVLGIPGNMPLPQRLDRVLFHLTFHDLWWESAAYRIPQMEPSRFLKQLHSAMVPGGAVLVIDHRARAGAQPRAETMARHRVDPAVVKAEMAAAGFRLTAESDLLANPGDDLARLVYDPAIRGQTSRFVLRFVRPLPGFSRPLACRTSSRSDHPRTAAEPVRQ